MSSTAAETGTGYQRTFGGRADQLSQVRRDIAGYLGGCPVTQDMVLIADEMAANSVLFFLRQHLRRPLPAIRRGGPDRGRGHGRPVAAPPAR